MSFNVSNSVSNLRGYSKKNKNKMYLRQLGFHFQFNLGGNFVFPSLI
jgi:hypothetical protein